MAVAMAQAGWGVAPAGSLLGELEPPPIQLALVGSASKVTAPFGALPPPPGASLRMAVGPLSTLLAFTVAWTAHPPFPGNTVRGLSTGCNAPGRRPHLYLGLAQEIHGLQVLQMPPVGPEDLAPGNLPWRQRAPSLEGVGIQQMQMG